MQPTPTKQVPDEISRASSAVSANSKRLIHVVTQLCTAEKMLAAPVRKGKSKNDECRPESCMAGKAKKTREKQESEVLHRLRTSS